MRKTTWALALMLALGVASAADKPDFSGFWKINNSKSDFGPMPSGPDKFERKIEHKDPELKMTTVQSFQGNERTSDVAYTIDGAQHTVKMGQGEAKVTATWKGKVLEISAIREIQGNEIKSLEKWTLSEDGKTLTSENNISTPQGDFAMKWVLDKQ
ncbi:MAG: hypothetical protein HZB13_22070 [Acidobacteria bacterium]|nr:hypothetical protein [Acidobacteriota bacterium]